VTVHNEISGEISMVITALKPIDDLSKLHPEAVIRKPDVLRLFPVSNSTWDTGVKSGRYPAPVRLSPRGVGWRLKDILALINEQGAA
jgi:prophage regulatory protein